METAEYVRQVKKLVERYEALSSARRSLYIDGKCLVPYVERELIIAMGRLAHEINLLEV